MLRLFSDTGRLLHSARILAKYDALIPAEYTAALPWWAKTLRWLFGSRATAEAGSPGTRLALALESLGPAYIKLGQVLATRPDLVGDDIADALQGLQDRLPPFPTEAAKRVVAEALGKPVDAMFVSFSDAVAAASIAQVHMAETNDAPPVRVAVKVLRPGVEKEFARDVSAFALAARVAERFSAEARRLRPIAVVQTLAVSVALELDLRMEAAGASELAERTKTDVNFHVPAVDWPRTAERVLTTEWIDGISIRETAKLAEAGHDPKRLSLLVIRSFLTQSLRDGFFHADMHPGNLFVDAQGRLVVVDFGIMGRLSPAMRRFMAETLAGFLARDYRRIAEVHFTYGFVPSHHSIDMFAQALRAIGEPIFGRMSRDVSMARLLQQLFETTRRFDMEAQPQLVLLQKTMVVVEGVARNLDPDFDIWEASRPVIEEWMIAQIGPERTLRDMGEGFGALGRLARDLPQLLRNVEMVSNMLAEGGLKLHPDTARQIAETEAARTRNMRIAVWVAIVMAAIALTIVAMRMV
ncbi:MAG TPA: 2-polyprenylphenol 6-hydroxylase [Rhizomicrobium sp.]|nr:2-polyprenylphenol 6-hydroxylase [Rhizomicrobium sp.]